MTSVTLNFDSGHISVPLEPDIDDLGRINFVVVKRRNGGVEIFETDTNGSLGTTKIGTYRSQVDANVPDVAAQRQHAHYHLILGTDPDPRYPQVAVDLDANPGLASSISAIDIGDLLKLQNLPVDLGQPNADLLCLGYTEVIGSHRRTIVFNTRQGGILTHLGVLDGDDTACLQTAGAQLNAPISATDLSLSVATTSGPLFTTSPPTGAKIIVSAREVMTVTAITGSSSPQTFTVTRDPNQRVAHSSAASVRAYRPLRLTL